MAPFDIVVLIIVGGALRSALVGKDASLLGPFISVATILLLDVLLGWLAARSATIERVITGGSVLLARARRLVPGAPPRHNIARAAFDRELRSHDLRSVAEVDEARLESNGRVTFLRRQ
jgi:uncharacterized membrane protein YcaP (DUF421 family)